MSDEPLWTTEEVATYLKMDIDTVRRLTREKKIRAFKPGKEYRYRKADIDAYLERSATIGEETPVR